ncbi:MAG: A/G-specific adenine glycosylase [Chloroflexota bacterium]|jgi:A/G-specific adenine glycosylase|nr:A/G-specific adenine glycosylase [Chloroflexota bacterium]
MPVDPGSLQPALASWYAANGRMLAFRRTRDPWSVLVSEVMLQQTQAARVEPAWDAFVGRFPTPAALSRASVADAVRAWAGLGYNRRAVNLWRAATEIVQRHDGRVPSDPEQLRALPGVGGYTARAVAAIAFGAATAAVDTNVRRVVGRICWGAAGAPSAAALQAAADRLVDPLRPDAWTHAVMDVGATICRPRNPVCGACPLQAWCRYASEATAAEATAAEATGADLATGIGTLPGIGTATAAASRGRRAPARQPFARTSRWLRGRIVDRLRLAPGGEWVRFDGPLGDHDQPSVLAALDALAADGLLERGPQGAVRLPGGMP